MSLRLIVAALGGDIHSGGRSANVPAPGHSRADRSVSLLLDGDRVVIHGFGAADWRAVREHPQGLGFIDPWGRLNSQGVQPRLRGGDPAFPCARHPSDGGRRYPSLQRRQLAAAAAIGRDRIRPSWRLVWPPWSQTDASRLSRCPRT